MSAQAVVLSPGMSAELSKHVSNIDDTSYLRVRKDSTLWRPLVSYMANNGHASNSFEVEQTVRQQTAAAKKAQKNAKFVRGGGARTLTTSGIGVEGDEDRKTALAMGIGVHPVAYEGETLFVVYQRVGRVVGTNFSPAVMEEIIVYAKGKGRSDVLGDFAEYVFGLSVKKPDDSTVRIYTYLIRNQYWKLQCIRRKRPMESVILDPKVKQRIIDELDDFRDPETAEWYAAHGIPYKKSILISGPPGTGKTSFLQAIAAKYDSALCFLQPGHPMMTDEAFHAAIQSAPENSILVLEDIDSLMTVDRKSGTAAPLTFSGVLNGLDGLAAPYNKIYFLTTNHPERLDPALIRYGRVDLKAEFLHASKQQISDMFKAFYPKDVAANVTFTNALEPQYDQISLAKLQQFFIAHRKVPAAKAATQIEEWLAEEEKHDEAIREAEKRALEKAAEKAKAKAGVVSPGGPPPPGVPMPPVVGVPGMAAPVGAPSAAAGAKSVAEGQEEETEEEKKSHRHHRHHQHGHTGDGLTYFFMGLAAAAIVVALSNVSTRTQTQ